MGDVMKESVNIALNYSKSLLRLIDPDNHFLDENHLHIHFPEGASKKDGPSAGITIVSAFLSLAL